MSLRLIRCRCLARAARCFTLPIAAYFRPPIYAMPVYAALMPLFAVTRRHAAFAMQPPLD